MESNEILCKILVLGDNNVGKTSIIYRYCLNKFPNGLATIGLDYRIKNVEHNNYIYKLQIWDIAREGRMKEIPRKSYNNCKGVLFILDITSKESLDYVIKQIDILVEYYKEDKDNHPVVYIVGNKSDLEEKRIIAREEVEKIGIDYGDKYFECSALKGEKVNDIFNSLIKDICDKFPIKEEVEEEPQNIQIIDEISKRCSLI